MLKVTLGSTGITVPKNGFGALPVQRCTVEDAVKILRKAYDNGIRYFDTARGYSDSEMKIGLALSEVRSDLYLATKTPSTTVEGFWKDLYTSLEMLKTDYIDVFQFHNPKFVPKPGDGTGLYEAMLEAKAKGLIRHIGITNHRAELAMEAIESGLYETLQYPFSYLSSERDIELVEACKARNVGFVAMKGLSGGLINNAAMAFAFMTKFDNVLPIWGIQREHELDDFLVFNDNPATMTPEMTEAIEKDRKALAGNFCRGCGYCAPCPQGIQIYLCARMSQLIRRSPSARFLSEENQKMMANAESCVNCRVCTTRCPYSLDIPKLLKENLADYKEILAGHVDLSN